MTEAPKVEQVDREALTHHEQMADAERQCVRCKLCGGRAKITDAGVGAGYFIECENGLAFRKSEGCLLAERRLSGWAYNVMEWWNRLHAATLTEPERTAKAVAEAVAAERERCARIADECADHEGPFTDYFRGRDQGCHDAAAAIRDEGGRGMSVTVYQSDDRKLFCRHCGRARWLHQFVRGVGLLCATTLPTEKEKP